MPSTIIPCLRYHDAFAAIDFLKRAFGFAEQAVFEGPDHTVAHAQLTLGDGMVMISSTRTEGEMAALIRQPEGPALAETQCPCLVVGNATEVYASSVAAGATIVGPLAAMPYGGMAFSCRDPEGHLWFVGEYDPWAPSAG